MGQHMHIRKIAEDDWDGIVALEAETYIDSDLSEEREALESRGNASPDTSFVLDSEQQIVGYCLALPYPMFQYPDLARGEVTVYRSRNLHLHDFVVAESFRGKGWSGQLLNRLMDTARSKGYEHISLVALGGADAFWSANGFQRRHDVALPQSYGPDAVYMTKEADEHVSHPR
ncbi:GNAT family N-acetyltransferase [Streptomyces sp. NPDC056486]|uniref:GNAT family N-acetyltransferase n=1 Tax=Streptomyces sp. NPDC056486 TaxID=3345835 RepID=UPI0036C810AB